MTLRLADLLGGLSIAADLGFGLPREESMRAALIATALARKLDLPSEQVRDAFYIPMLVHIGCVSYAHESARDFGNEIEMTQAVSKTNLGNPSDIFTVFLPEMMRGKSALDRARLITAVILKGRNYGRGFDLASCEVARETARRVGLPESTQLGLYTVAEAWKGAGAPHGLEGDDIPVAARVARLAGEAAFFDDIGDAELAVQAVRERAGTLLDPELCEAFAANGVEVLAEASRGDPRDLILEAEPAPVIQIEPERVPEIAEAFGDATDLKTPYTHGHAKGVAELCVKGAERLGLGQETILDLRVAALLHDVGRVGVTDAIWDKPGPLNTTEWEQVRLHPYLSERILATSRSLEPLARLAGMHHERLDGSGYHRGCGAGEIPVGGRLLAAADALNAMTQNRAHRQAKSVEVAADELRDEAAAGRLDEDVVKALLDTAGAPAPVKPVARPAGLSDREIEVLRLVAEGCSNPDVAKRLTISRRTAEHHVQHIYTKIGVSSRAGAALFALEHDLLERSFRIDRTVDR